MKLVRLILITLIINSTLSCGDSYNSRIFQGDKGITQNALNCKPGCYGFPQEWYDLGIIIDKDGNPITAIDPEVKKAGLCYFKLCDDPDSSYNKDALEWISRFGGDITYDDTDIVKCDLLKSTHNVIFSIHSNSVEFEKEPGC